MPDMPDSIFTEGQNCHAVANATQATVLVDCAAYYRALHQSICRARKSIFILGWDIDSRISLLRGQEAEEARVPTRFFDLIQWKARTSPGLRVYLNRWNYAFYLIPERELFAPFKWWAQSPRNVHYCMDGALPYGASHHQKVVVIDDEVAFNGGMDVARCRWDYREHYPFDRRRLDPPGLGQSLTSGKFGPYHDTQIVMCGDVVKPLARLVRDRWKAATGQDAIPLTEKNAGEAPEAWPPCAKPHLFNVKTGVALTRPPYRNQSGLTQARQLYIDMIGRAETFIYMENQYFCEPDIAAAINRRLKEAPNLRVMLISSFDPQGFFERKSMWAGRVDFRKIASRGVEDRFLMAYSVSHENAYEKSVRIHSKLMAVDDIYLRVGSSNINRRSMSLDTECDVVIEGNTQEARQSIAATRNDLIREHSGREIRDIEQIIGSGGDVRTFLNDVPDSRQHLREIDDSPYENERFSALATWIADRQTPFWRR